MSLYHSTFQLIIYIFSRITGYSTVSTDDAAFIIGGSRSEGWPNNDAIAEFRNDQWQYLGTLRTGRHDHGSITIGTDTLIIGGLPYGGS